MRGVSLKLKLKKYEFPLVEILWDDAADLQIEGWTSSDNIDTKHQIAITVGFLVKETEEHVVVAHTIDNNGEVTGLMQIPKGMIQYRSDVKALKKVAQEQISSDSQ